MTHERTGSREQHSTLLNRIWNAEGSADEIVEATVSDLESGALVLTGNFKGREADMAADARETR